MVQAYEGLVHMDFEAEGLAGRGHGSYTPLDVAALPPLYLAYAADPSDSGRIHAPVKQRWLAGEPAVVTGMATIAAQADVGLALCRDRPYAAAADAATARSIASAWAAAFTTNFDTRRALFGDAALGAANLRMIGIARQMGAAAKFPGSGGAVVGVIDVDGMVAAGSLPGQPATAEAGAAALASAFTREGFVFTRLMPCQAGAAAI